MSIMMQIANLRDHLENLFGCSSPVTFSSETSLFLFTEAGVTPVGNRSQVNLFACTLTPSRTQIQKWHNKLTLTSVIAWWEKDNSDFPQKFAGSLKYGLRAEDQRLLHRFQPKMSKLKSCQIHTIYLENFTRSFRKFACIFQCIFLCVCFALVFLT